MSTVPHGDAETRAADRRTDFLITEDREPPVDAAIAIFQRMLPDYGLKLVLPPPATDGTHADAFVTVWRRGDTRALTYRAPTPTPALLGAVRSERERHQDEERKRSCARCAGVGWYIVSGGTKQPCRHPSASLAEDGG